MSIGAGTWLDDEAMLESSSRAGSLPQEVVVFINLVFNAGPIVGAGLLAKAVGQLAWMLDVKAPSRATPLPQVIWGVLGFVFSAGPLWERACSR